MKGAPIAAALMLAASSADAAWRIGLEALSPDGARAVVVYDADWVEMDLESAEMTRLRPPDACAWTSAAYEPQGGGVALTAYCDDAPSCAEKRADLWRLDGDRLTRAATAKGRRWNDAVWSVDGSVIATETPLITPRATGLSDLGRGASCERGAGRFVAIAPGSGRIAALDILPEGWSAVAPLGGDPSTLLARVRAAPPEGRGGGTTAEGELAAICAAAAPDRRRGACGPQGIELYAEWAGGDWRLADMQDGPDGAKGRLLSTPSRAVSARERCAGRRVDGRLKAQCEVTATGPFGARTIAAPEALFGDLALSADGRTLAALAAGRGVRTRRFDLFDLETGARRDFSRLLALTPRWEERAP